jgi:hypothetical protein
MLHPTLRVRPGRIVGFATGLLIPTFLFALFLSLAPQVHQRIHSDANQSQHECAITLLASGSYDHAVAAPAFDPSIAGSQFTQLPTLNSTWVGSLFLSASIFEHAPPAQS